MEWALFIETLDYISPELVGPVVAVTITVVAFWRYERNSAKKAELDLLKTHCDILDKRVQCLEKKLSRCEEERDTYLRQRDRLLVQLAEGQGPL